MSKSSQIISQPQIQQSFLRGTDKIVNAIRPTLGPVARHVAIDHIVGQKAPELLDEGGVIARRIIELPHRTENAGAMLVRHMLWQLHETVGDGTATAGVIFQSIYREGIRYLNAGGNAMLLRQHLERDIPVILTELDRQVIPLQGNRMLVQAAESISHEPKLATVLGEIFDVIGPFGKLDIRAGHQRGYETDYYDGSYWTGGVFSDQMIREKFLNSRQLQNAIIFISDLEIEDPHDLVPLMQTAIREEVQSLVIVARKISDRITGLLIQNEKPGRFDIVAVRPPGTAVGEQMENLKDLALLTGGTPLFQAAGDSVQQVKLESLGRSRRAWADKKHFGVAGGQGSVDALRSHIQELQARYERADDLEVRKQLQKRIGHLLGGSAILKVGGTTESERDFRKRQAERTVSALRGAMSDGILPGGGVALLACQPALRRLMSDSQDADQRAAYNILLRALEAPLEAIAANAGYEPASTSAQVKQAGTGCGFDVMKGEMVDMLSAGIYDSAAVVKAGVQTAISTAALALTTDVLIQQKTPPQSVKP